MGMTSDPGAAEVAATSTATDSTAAALSALPALPSSEPLPKIDPITAVQDSIDSLALSLFEALRGVRDAVAPESLEAPGARPSGAAGAALMASTAFGEPNEEMEKDASARERLLNGLNLEYFPPRAFDLLEPDYEAFLLAYLSDNPYAKDLVERFAALADEKNKPGGKAMKETTTAPSSSSGKKEIALGDVGYEFRKKFGSGWYTGRVTEIRPLAAFDNDKSAANGYDRRCVYTDGDMEDLRLEDLQELVRLDPKSKKPRLSINSKATTTASKSEGKETSEGGTGICARVKFPLTQAEYTKHFLETEHQRDVRTTQLLADDVLAKSAAVNDLVAKLPGMSRTRKTQMERIGELIRQNHEVTRELEGAYARAQERREAVRVSLGKCTCSALGVEEEM